jgi:hypothetical protein
MVLISLAGISVNALRRGRDLPDLADRLTSALRMARADAATRGQRIRLSFDDADEEAETLGRFEIELDPLAEPGTFSPYQPPWADVLNTAQAEVIACRLAGRSTWSVMQALRGEDGQATPPILFYPDGSCDAAEIHLRMRDIKDGPVAIITLDDLSARATAEILSAEDYDQYEETARP